MKIIGLDIAEDAVSGVLLHRGLRGVRVIACASESLSGAEGREGSLSQVLRQLDAQDVFCITALAGESLSFRNLEVPFRDSKKIRRILPFELEAELPYSSEDILVDFMAVNETSEMTELLAAAAPRTVVSGHLAKLQSLGFEPELLGVRNVALAQWLLDQDGTKENGILLELGTARANMVCFLNRRIVLVRSFPLVEPLPSTDARNTTSLEPSLIHSNSILRALARSVENTVHAFLVGTDASARPEAVFLTGPGSRLTPRGAERLERFMGLPALPVEMSRDTGIEWEKKAVTQWRSGLMDNALALALQDNSNGRAGFNFLRNKSEKRWSLPGIYKEFRMALTLVLVILGLFVIDRGVELYSLQRKYHQYDALVREHFVRTFPDVGKIVAPVHQMRQKIAELKKTIAIPGTGNQQHVLKVLEEISSRIPKNVDVRVVRLVLDQEGLTLKGDTDTFNSVDSIKKGLAGAPLFKSVEIEAANIDQSGKRVRFEMRAQLQ